MNETFAIDLAERAVKTFLQGALGAAALILITVDAKHAIDAAWWVQVGSAALVGGISSVASMVTSVLASLKTGTASLSTTVAQSAVLRGNQATADAAIVTLPAAVIDQAELPDVTVRLDTSPAESALAEIGAGTPERPITFTSGD